VRDQIHDQMAWSEVRDQTGFPQTLIEINVGGPGEVAEQLNATVLKAKSLVSIRSRKRL